MPWNHVAGTNSFYPIPTNQNVVGEIPAGAYSVHQSMTGPYIVGQDLKNEELLSFNEGPTKEVIEEIVTFWDIQEEYNKIGVPYRRGILMYGPPGTGKSAIIRMICEKVIEKNGIVALCNSVSDAENWEELLKNTAFDKNVVFIMEDIDDMLKYDEQVILQLLDGITSGIAGSVFLASTNYIENLADRIIRPSRFDLLIEVKEPTAEIREAYARELYKRYDREFNPGIIEASEGFSFAHIKEMIISSLLYDKPLEQLKKRLKQRPNLVLEDE